MARWLRGLEQVSLVLVGVLSLLVWAGARAEQQPARDDDPQPAAFKLAAAANPAGAAPGTRTFLATAGTGDEQARFLIVLNGERRSAVDDKGNDPGFDISFSSGSFRHVAGSKPGPFLRRVATALLAKAPKLSQAKADVLPFEMAILGPPAARDPRGGFTGKPGTWVVSKLFLADGDAEVYFNFDPVSGDAELSFKDEDYGNRVVEELSKVLW